MASWFPCVASRTHHFPSVGRGSCSELRIQQKIQSGGCAAWACFDEEITSCMIYSLLLWNLTAIRQISMVTIPNKGLQTHMLVWYWDFVLFFSIMNKIYIEIIGWQVTQCTFSLKNLLFLNCILSRSTIFPQYLNVVSCTSTSFPVFSHNDVRIMAYMHVLIQFSCGNKLYVVKWQSCCLVWGRWLCTGPHRELRNGSF